MFQDAVRSNAYVKDVDIYLITTSGSWSLIHVGAKLAPEIAAEVENKGRHKVMADDGRTLTAYSRYRSEGPVMKDNPVSTNVDIRIITYDTGLARAAGVQAVTTAHLVLAPPLPTVLSIALH